MRILHVIDQLSGGGAERSLVELLGRPMEGHSHGVAILVPDDGAHAPLVPDDVRVLAPPRPLRGRMARIRWVHRCVTDRRPDLIHTTLYEADLAGRVAGLLTSTPVLTSLVNTPYVEAALHDRDVPPLKLRGARVVDAVGARYATDAFHAITDAVATDAVATLGIDPAKITVVPRGRDPDRLGEVTPERRRRARWRLRLDEADPLLLTLGREEPQKGHVHLIAALDRLTPRLPDPHLVMAGRPGNSSSAIDAAVAEHGLDDRVHRLGFVDGIGDLLAASDIFVFPSLYEGLGGAVLEAMAANIPIVATDVPALREVTEHGRGAVLVPPEDPDALADALVAVVEDPAAARERAEAARRRFEQRYTLDAAAEGMRRLYDDLAERLP